MSFEKQQLKKIIEAALMASGQTLSIDQIMVLFLDDQQPERDEVKAALQEIAEDCEQRGIELKQVSSGYRFQARQEYSQWISRLWEEKPPRYSRALLETLVLIAYRQPITRGEIEDVRGVTVSTQIIKTLLEREWVKVVGHRDVPGKPALYATTKDFLDYFNLKSLEDLPTLAEIRDLDKINAELAFEDPEFEQPEQDLEKMMGEDAEEAEETEEMAEAIASGVEESPVDSDLVEDDITDEDSNQAIVAQDDTRVGSNDTEELITDLHDDSSEDDIINAGEIHEDEVEARMQDADSQEPAMQEDETQDEEADEMLYASDEDDTVSRHDAHGHDHNGDLVEQQDESVKAITEDADGIVVLNT